MTSKVSRLKGTLFVAIALFAAACTSGEDSQEIETDSEDKPVVLAVRGNWPSGYFQTEIYTSLLRRLEFDVPSPADMEPTEAYARIAANQVNFWATGEFPRHESFLDLQLNDGSLVRDNVIVLGNPLPGASLFGFVITKSVVDQHNIQTLDQINAEPALTALFDSDGNGLAELRGCPPGDPCELVIEDMLLRNGWNNLELVSEDFEAAFDRTAADVAAGVGAIQYIWSPSGQLAQLTPGDSVLWLALGSEPPQGSQSVALGDICTAEPCWLGWDAADIKVVANSEFLGENPKAKKLFEIVELDVEDVVDQINRYNSGENTDADVQRHAAEWIADHQELVDGWLSEANAAG